MTLRRILDAAMSERGPVFVPPPDSAAAPGRTKRALSLAIPASIGIAAVLRVMNLGWLLLMTWPLFLVAFALHAVTWRWLLARRSDRAGVVDLGLASSTLLVIASALAIDIGDVEATALAGMWHAPPNWLLQADLALWVLWLLTLVLGVLLPARAGA